MAMNGVGEMNRRKLVSFAFAVLTQLPTFQVRASESAGANVPEITAKVYWVFLIHQFFLKAIITDYLSAGIPRFTHIWSHQGVRKRKMGEG